MGRGERDRRGNLFALSVAVTEYLCSHAIAVPAHPLLKRCSCHLLGCVMSRSTGTGVAYIFNVFEIGMAIAVLGDCGSILEIIPPECCRDAIFSGAKFAQPLCAIEPMHSLFSGHD